MRIPGKVRIAGVEHEVVLHPEGIISGGSVLYGEISYTNSVIRLNTLDIGKQMQEMTLWHEMLHAVCKQYDLDLGDREESVIEAMSRGVYQILEDNIDRLYPTR